MIDERSPRWIKLVPSTAYGCLWVLFVVAAGGIGYVWLALYTFRLTGVAARVAGLAITFGIGFPAVWLLSRSRLRLAAQRWSRWVDLDDTRKAVELLAIRYELHHRERDLRKARRLLATLRTRNRNPTIGSDIEERIGRAAVVSQDSEIERHK